MNGIEKITARIEADCQADVAAILAEGQAKADKVKAEYAEKAAAQAKAAEEAGVQAAQRQLERLESAAQMDAKKQLLAAKQACLDDAFAGAKQKLLAMDDDQYAALLAKLAVNAAKSGREEIVLSQRDRDRVGAMVVSKANAILAEASAPGVAGTLKGSKAGNLLSRVVTGANALLQGTAQLSLSKDTADIEGGLILRDGNVEVNCAFETLLRMLREDMAAQVAGILFA